MNGMGTSVIHLFTTNPTPAPAFATNPPPHNGHEIIDSTKSLEKIVEFLLSITQLLGIIMVLMGIIKLIIAFGEEDGAGYQKAAMFIGVGIVLIILDIFIGYMTGGNSSFFKLPAP